MNVRVVEYDEKWSSRFQQEAERIEELLGQDLIEIHHIGSTSVPGLRAKPIIDIMPVVRRIDRVDKYNSQMGLIGYESMGEYGITGRRYFRKGGDNRTHQVHVFESGDINVRRHLAFRDYLRTHRADALRYASLKIDLAQKFPSDIQSYSAGKDAFVKEVEQKALSWYEKQNSQ